MLPDPTPRQSRQSTATSSGFDAGTGHAQTATAAVNFKTPICLPLTPFWPPSFLFDPGISAVEPEDAGCSLEKSFRSFCVPPPQSPVPHHAKADPPVQTLSVTFYPPFCLISSTQVHRVPVSTRPYRLVTPYTPPNHHPCGARRFDLKMRLPWGLRPTPNTHYLFICVTFFVAVI